MTRVNDSKRPREDPARRGGQVRPGRGFTAANCMPTNTPYSASQWACPWRSGTFRVSPKHPLVVWMRERKSKGLKSQHLVGACRRGRRLCGLNGMQVHSPVSWRCLPRRLLAWAKAWWPVALSLYQLRAVWGATGQLSGIWLGLWGSASGGAAQSASLLIFSAMGN